MRGLVGSELKRSLATHFDGTSNQLGNPIIEVSQDVYIRERMSHHLNQWSAEVSMYTPNKVTCSTVR